MVNRLLPGLDGLTKRNFILDFYSAAFYGLYDGLLFPFIAVIALRLGASNFEVGLLSAAQNASLLLSFYWGSLVQGKRLMPYVMWPNLIGRGVLLLMLFVDAPLPYVALIIAFWLTSSAGSAPYAGLIEKIYPTVYRGRLLGYVRVIMALCHLITVAMAGMLLDIGGHKLTLPLAAVFGLISTIVFTRVTEPPAAPVVGIRRMGLAEQLGLLMNDKVFLMWEIGFMVFGIGNLVLAPLYPIFQVKYLGLTNIQVSMVSSLWTVAWMVAYAVWGSVIDRKNPGTVLIIAVFFYGLTGLSYWAGRSFYAVLLAALFAGTAEAAFDVGWMSQCLRLAPGRASVYSGIHLTVLGVRGLVGPFLGTALLGWIGLTNAVLTGALMVLCGIVPLLFAYRRQIREETLFGLRQGGGTPA
jgi:MFS transporter, DHA1 family, staphyloferrin B biosynthesis exporter